MLMSNAFYEPLWSLVHLFSRWGLLSTLPGGGLVLWSLLIKFYWHSDRFFTLVQASLEQ